ncbi:MAG TPA: hypothetical protein VNL92_05435 [Dehalococcoidia bacterium]|nr:hypothetical protein [Dehalococcoidia bacterium]
MADRGDRVEREIEDILRKIDDFPTEAARRRERRGREAPQASLGQRLARRIGRITPAQLMIASMVLVFAGFLIVDPIEANVAKYMIIAGLILFFSSFVLSFRPARRQQAPKRWRGRVIEPDRSSGRGIRGWWGRR